MSKQPEMFGAEFTFTQDGDSCDGLGNLQQLEVSVEDAGGGKYLVIKTERWAMDSIDDLTALLERVKAAFGEGWYA